MNKVVFAFGVVGGIITNFLGGWDTALIVLVVFMLVDYLTGIINAAVFKNSTKTVSGGLSSKAGVKGLCRKIFVLLGILVACQLDVLLNTQVLRNVTIMMFCANELISITENFGLMGIKFPAIVTNAIDILKQKDLAKPAAQELEETPDDKIIQ